MYSEEIRRAVDRIHEAAVEAARRAYQETEQAATRIADAATREAYAEVDRRRATVDAEYRATCAVAEELYRAECAGAEDAYEISEQNSAAYETYLSTRMLAGDTYHRRCTHAQSLADDSIREAVEAAQKLETASHAAVSETVERAIRQSVNNMVQWHRFPEEPIPWSVEEERYWVCTRTWGARGPQTDIEIAWWEPAWENHGSWRNERWANITETVTHWAILEYPAFPPEEAA